jgi:hypothetical protein
MGTSHHAHEIEQIAGQRITNKTVAVLVKEVPRFTAVPTTTVLRKPISLMSLLR